MRIFCSRRVVSIFCLMILGISCLGRSRRSCRYVWKVLESRASIKPRSFLMSSSTHSAMHSAMSAMRIESPNEGYDHPMLSPSYMMVTSPSDVPDAPPVMSAETPRSFMSCDSTSFVHPSKTGSKTRSPDRRKGTPFPKVWFVLHCYCFCCCNRVSC